MGFFNIRSPFFYHFTRLKMYRKPWWIELEKQRKLVGPTQVVLQVSTHRHLIDYLSRRTTISQLSLKLTYYNCRWLKSIIQSKYVIRWLNTIAWLWNIKYFDLYFLAWMAVGNMDMLRQNLWRNRLSKCI